MSETGGEPLELVPVRRTSRLSGFYRLPPQERRRRLVEARWLTPEEAEALTRMGRFGEPDADAMIENVVGLHALPLAVALNFRINGEERVLPMAVEEPSIVAAASYAARLVADGGGFLAEADPPVLAAQIQLLDVPDTEAALRRLHAAEPELLAAADALIPRMVARGGGARGLEVRLLAPDMLCVHVHVDCR
ncbi:MAG: 3-hydroxy-3-methylglutaryl-CoA reductase, partial [Myxococcales bacterium]